MSKAKTNRTTQTGSLKRGQQQKVPDELMRMFKQYIKKSFKKYMERQLTADPAQKIYHHK